MSTYENISQETLLTVPLTDIVAPSLNDVNYASALNNVFENINNNFKTLANHEFVKGDKGKSVEIVPTSFFYNDYIIDKAAVDESFKKMNLPINYRRFFDGTENYYGELLKKTILSLSNNEKDYDDANGYSIFSNFTKDNAGRIQMLVNTDDINDESAPASSLYYVFLDGRYANKNLGNAEESQYTNIKDFSCILVYNSKMHDSNGEYLKDENDNFVDGFEVLSNAFPTIYYEKNVGLCWKLNGIGTGIPVKGAMGKNGKDANIVIVRANAVNESNEIGSGVQTEITEEYKRPLLNVVTGVYENYFGYNSISDYSESALEELSDCTALILTNTQDYLVDENGNYITDAGKDENGKWNDGNYILDPNCNKFYFGKLSYETDKEDSTSTKKKLYAYCNPGTSINSAITTENIINVLKNINIKNESVNAASGLKGLFIPIENTGSDKQKAHLLTATAITDGFETIKSDFLFTPVNDINTVSPTATNEFKVDKYLYIKIPKSHQIFGAANVNSIKNFNDFKDGDSNYCLKYKLSSFIQQKGHLIFDETNEHSKDSMYFGYGVNPENVKYYTFSETEGSYKYVDKSIDSMPFSFISLLSDSTEVSDAKGIYRWELCYDKNDFDVNELLIDVDYDTVFPDCFKSIFTTDLTPSKSSEIMWFNGVNTVVSETSDKTVINGWTKNNGFEIIKFIPIYNIDDNKISTDTALNLNYNVNITGDEANYTRDLNVTGNINCANSNIDNTLYVNKINNVFTENDIITTRDLRSRNFKVEDGHVTAQSAEFSKNIIGNSIRINKDIEATDLNIEAKLNIGKNSIYTNDENKTTIDLNDVSTLNINNVSKLKIESYNTAVNIPDNTSRLESSLSTFNKDNSLIVLSNGSVVDDSIYIKNTPRSAEILQDGSTDTYFKQDPGEGVSAESNIINTSFESAKNFNIHRLSFQSKKQIDETENTDIINAERDIFKSTDATEYPYYINYNYNLPNDEGSDEFEFNNYPDYIIRCNDPEKDYVTSLSLDMIKDLEDHNDYYAKNKGNYHRSNTCKYFAKFPFYMDDLRVIKENDNKPTIRIPENIKITIDKEFIINVSSFSRFDNTSWIKPFSGNSYLRIVGNLCYKSNSNHYVFLQEVYKKDLNINFNVDESEYEYSLGIDGTTGKIADKFENIDLLPSRNHQIVFKLDEEIDIPQINESAKKSLLFHLKEHSINYKNYEVCINFYAYYKFDYDKQSNSTLSGDAKIVEFSTYKPHVYDTDLLKDINTSYAKTVSLKDFVTKHGQPDSAEEKLGTLSYNFKSIKSTESNNNTNDSNIKTTTLCNDGLVTRAGTYVFGLGFAETIINHEENEYDIINDSRYTSEHNPHWKIKHYGSDEYKSFKQNVPVLFYHKYDKRYYDYGITDVLDGSYGEIKPNNSTTTTKGYAQRTNAIPLEDIFNAIRVLRENGTMTYGV